MTGNAEVKVSEQVRAEFEAWALKNYVVPGCDSAVERSTSGNDSGYRFGNINAAWHGWQASRAALVIELPDEYELPKEATFAALTKSVHAQVRRAIEAAGVRVQS